jgi:hypothetical protein
VPLKVVTGQETLDTRIAMRSFTTVFPGEFAQLLGRKIAYRYYFSDVEVERNTVKWFQLLRLPLPPAHVFVIGVLRLFLLGQFRVLCKLATDQLPCRICCCCSPFKI